jgi:cytochrome c oxidase subunit 4
MMSEASSERRHASEAPSIGSIVRRPPWVLLVLLVVLAANIGAAFLPVPVFVRTAFHLLMAAVTVAFIAFIFMELERKGTTMRLFAGAGFVWLAILFLLIFSDYGTRP